MSDSNRIACPSCDRSYRWKPELAGQKVKCKCGEKFRIAEQPDTPESDSYDLSHDSATTSPLAEALQGVAPKSPASQRRCPSCNANVSESAVICINCGADMRSGKKVQTVRSEVAVAGNPHAPTGLKLVRIGLILNLNAVVLTSLLVISPLGVIWVGEDILTYISYASYAVSAVQTIGTLLCLAAPKESGGRLVLAISILLAFGAGVADAMIEAGLIPDMLSLLSGLMRIASTVCFLAFFIQLARYLAFDEITAQAEKLLSVYVVLLIASLVTIVPVVGCFTGLFVIGWAIYAAILYIVLLVDLNRAVAYRIRESD